MRVLEEIPSAVVQTDQVVDQLITVCEVDIQDQAHETLEVVVTEDLLETPTKRKRKEEIGNLTEIVKKINQN